MSRNLNPGDDSSKDESKLSTEKLSDTASEKGNVKLAQVASSASAKGKKSESEDGKKSESDDEKKKPARKQSLRKKAIISGSSGGNGGDNGDDDDDDDDDDGNNSGGAGLAAPVDNNVKEVSSIITRNDILRFIKAPSAIGASPIFGMNEFLEKIKRTNEGECSDVDLTNLFMGRICSAGLERNICLEVIASIVDMAKRSPKGDEVGDKLRGAFEIDALDVLDRVFKEKGLITGISKQEFETITVNREAITNRTMIFLMMLSSYYSTKTTRERNVISLLKSFDSKLYNSLNSIPTLHKLIGDIIPFISRMEADVEQEMINDKNPIHKYRMTLFSKGGILMQYKHIFIDAGIIPADGASAQAIDNLFREPSNAQYSDAISDDLMTALHAYLEVVNRKIDHFYQMDKHVNRMDPIRQKRYVKIFKKYHELEAADFDGRVDNVADLDSLRTAHQMSFN